jgi:Spy/CpxP family protein refolding chaperone
VDPQPGRNPNPKARNRQIQRQQLMEAVGLTADQRTRMGEINRAHQDEAISIGRRVRQARNALDRAIMNPVVDEAQIKRHTEELASAQADQVRFQSRMRAQMRSVLTADQVRRLMQLEQERRREMREERREQEIERIR